VTASGPDAGTARSRHDAGADADERATAVGATGGTRVVADSVTYGYEGSDGQEVVLSDASLAAEPGEVVALVGPSGTGKTTLLRLLALFDPPDEGRVTVDGRDAWTLSAEERLRLRRRIAFVFQDRSLFTGSVARNVAYGLTVRRSWRERIAQWLRGLVGRAVPADRIAGVAERFGLDRASVPTRVSQALETVGLAGPDDPDVRVTRALETVGLGGMADRNAGSLSAGEAQRVAVARSLATDPAVMLLDEPTSNLDPRNTAAIEDAVEDARDRGIAVVLATHDMAQARRVADRSAVMLDGTVIEQGPTERVFDDPDDDRARAFVRGELVY
jgi:tungstate transport system ATP-binding protein